jgi:alpha-ketoglutarate-dependent taurine dioxygenase
MSLLASSFAIHNAILGERPDLMPALYRGYRCRHSEAESSGEDPTTAHRVPVFGPVGDRLVCNFHARPMARSFAHDSLESDPKALEAFEMFKAVSERDGFVHRMMLEPGDLQFLNNRTVLHGRTEFEDDDSLDRKRLMLRLWLAMPDWAPLPDNMKTH